MPRESQEEHWPGLALAVTALLRDRGWTQTELSVEAGLSRPRINQAIASERVTPRVYEALAAAFGMNADDLRGAARRMHNAAVAVVAPGTDPRTVAERAAAFLREAEEMRARAEAEAREEEERRKDAG